MVNGRRIAALALLGLMLAAFAYSGLAQAASELGRLQFSGKVIILFDDNSWKYAEEAAANTPANGVCDGGAIVSKVLPITLCMNGAVWGEQPHGAGLEAFYTLKDTDLFVAMITERTPLDEAFLREAIISNAANAAGVTTAEVKVLKEESVTINATPWRYIEYSMKMAGTIFHYANFYRQFPEKGSAQVVFFTSDNLFEESRIHIEKLMMSATVAQ